MEQEQLYILWDLQGGKCALSGVYLTWQTGEGSQDFNASIDRKDPNKGYIPENIQLVAFRVNVMKHTLGESEFYWWCKNIIAKIFARYFFCLFMFIVVVGTSLVVSFKLIDPFTKNVNGLVQVIYRTVLKALPANPALQSSYLFTAVPFSKQ